MRDSVPSGLGDNRGQGAFELLDALDGLTIFTVLVLIFLYAPIVLVMLNAFNKDEFLTHWGGFTTHWFSNAINNPRVRQDFRNSFTIAVLSALISVAIAVPAALWARRASDVGTRTLDATTYMRIVLPETVVAISLFILFVARNFSLGVATIVIGHVVFNSAYATVIIQAGAWRRSRPRSSRRPPTSARRRGGCSGG